MGEEGAHLIDQHEHPGDQAAGEQNRFPLPAQQFGQRQTLARLGCLTLELRGSGMWLRM